MKFHTLKSVWVIAACCSSVSPATADGESELLFFVSADYLQRQSVSTPAVQSSDLTPRLDILYSYSNGPWRILGEYYATDDEAELERLQLGYEFSTDTTLWLGRFHQPISAWNYRFHHGAYLQPSISRPSVENWEDENGILPAHVTGAMFDSWVSLGENSGIRYVAAIGLAPIFENGELRPFDFIDPDDGATGVAGSLNVAYYPDYVGENSIGLISGYADIEVLPDQAIGLTSEIRLRQKIFGGQISWRVDRWSVLSAAYYVDISSNGPGDVFGGYFAAAYLQGTYDLAQNFDFYARVEGTKNPNTSYLQLSPSYVYQRELVGLRWDIRERQALHFEVSNDHITNDRYSEIRVQWSTAFP